MSRIDSELSRELVNDALRSDEKFVVLNQTSAMFRATVGNLHSEVHALLETIAADGNVRFPDSPHDFVLAYAVRRLSDVRRTLRDIERVEAMLRADAARRPGVAMWGGA